MVGGWRDETFFGLYYVDLYAIIPIQMGSVVWFPNIIQTTINLPYQPLCLWSPDPFPKKNIGSIINPLTSAPCIFGQFVWVSCRRFFDFWLGDLYLTHVSECDWNMWRENTCIKKHLYITTGSGIVPYISYTSIQQHLLPKLWLKQLPPDTVGNVLSFQGWGSSSPKAQAATVRSAELRPPG